MRGDDDDQAGALKREAVGEAREWEQPGIGADALVSGEFIDLDHEREAAAMGEKGGGAEKEGVALVDDRAIFACEERAVAGRGDEVVGDLQQFENERRRVRREAGEEAAALLFGKGIRTRGGARIDAGGAGENDAMAETLEGRGDAGDVDAFRAGALGAEVVEDVHAPAATESKA